MTGSVAARRYAKALFDLAKASGPEALQHCSRDIAALTSLAKENPELVRFFADPVFTAEEKHKVIAALGERLGIGSMFRDFCYLLADKKRLALLTTIAGEYQALADAENGVLRGEFISAFPLAEDKQNGVIKKLEKNAGKTLALEFKVDEALLGGMILKVGDNVMDASLKTQLSLLKDTIKRGA